MSVWDEHVTAALLGTQRRRPPRLAGAPGGADPAARLLDQAALLTAGRRAGRLPATAEPVAPAPAETAPIVPPAAADRLWRILSGEQARVLPEWLDTAARGGYRVPPRFLPELLHKGRSDRAIRPYIARAAGRRGLWLAMQNIDWAYLVVASGGESAEDPQVWETGERTRRIAHLMRLRATDPAAARVTLLTTWAREPAPERALFLATFEQGLSAADEEFLEAALDDRGLEVRRIAADLLARLPGTAYARRMTGRARGCLRVAGAPDGRGEEPWLVVEPPVRHDDAMLRDGIPYHAAERVGNRAGWLREILARTPLSIWTEASGLSPARLVRLPVVAAAALEGGSPAEARHGPLRSDGHHGRDVHIGWARAAVRQRAGGWARALLAADVVLDDVAVVADLLGVLSPKQRDGAAADIVRGVGGRADPLPLLERIPGPWSGALADAVVAALDTASAVSGDARFLTTLCRLAGERLTPDAAPRLDSLAARHSRPGPLTELAHSLRFRHEMLAELRRATPTHSKKEQ